MNFENLPFYSNKILFGHDPTQKLVAVEIDTRQAPCQATLFYRKDDKITNQQEDFFPFVLVQSLSFLRDFKREWFPKTLAGNSEYSYIAFCKDSNTLQAMLAHLKKVTRQGYGSPYSPYLYYSDLVNQYLVSSGKTLFKGMTFNHLHRMQLDIETYCHPDFEFSNPERESDKIIIIAMSDNRGWKRILSLKDFDEPQLLKEMVREIQERDPDVIEGHNIHKFDFEYISTRARMHKVRLKVGRDKSALKKHNSRMSIAERKIVYPKYEIYGRHIIDTWILAQHYDVTARELESYSLKDIARHFQVSPAGRVYVEGSKIASTWDKDPDTLLKYATHDVEETRGISGILSPPYFMQTQIFPFSYQNVTVRGNATRIDTLFVREYLRQEHAIPKPPQGRSFAGAYTDIFQKGLVKNVLHVDVASLYPSVMLAFQYFPARDSLKIFESLLKDLREFRLQAKKEMKETQDFHEKDFLNALQNTFKILINSFYGYLGFSFGHFADFDMAEATTAKGQEIIRQMVDWLKIKNCRLIELDTDGIYFTPPDSIDTTEKEDTLVEELNATLPEGIEVELDGRYKAMFSYKMKNYILLDYDNKMYIKGSGFKSRGLELFQRKFIEEMFFLLLTDNKSKIPGLLEEYKQRILKHEWEVRDFQKSETLQESLDTYSQKIEESRRNPAAVYELALESQRDYRTGDQISYYITGNKKTVTAYKNCKMAYLWDKATPDENVKYYAGKLDALYKKFNKLF
ncbi:MAG: DNA polymerase domain-containing protein [Vulcanimicrobiota bacterium]